MVWGVHEAWGQCYSSSMNSGKIVAGRDGKIEGSIRGPRRPKNCWKCAESWLHTLSHSAFTRQCNGHVRSVEQTARSPFPFLQRQQIKACQLDQKIEDKSGFLEVDTKWQWDIIAKIDFVSGNVLPTKFALKSSLQNQMNNHILCPFQLEANICCSKIFIS